VFIKGEKRYRTIYNVTNQYAPVITGKKVCNMLDIVTGSIPLNQKIDEIVTE
jgi:hypothetical protein